MIEPNINICGIKLLHKRFSHLNVLMCPKRHEATSWEPLEVFASSQAYMF